MAVTSAKIRQAMEGVKERLQSGRYNGPDAIAVIRDLKGAPQSRFIPARDWDALRQFAQRFPASNSSK